MGACGNILCMELSSCRHKELTYTIDLKIHDLKFSPDGSKFLVISGTIQPKLYDRDGEEM